jgi:hypothetical protein
MMIGVEDPGAVVWLGDRGPRASPGTDSDLSPLTGAACCCNASTWRNPKLSPPMVVAVVTKTTAMLAWVRRNRVDPVRWRVMPPGLSGLDRT